MKALLFSMPDIYPEWRPRLFSMPNLALASMAGNCPEHEVFVGDLVLKRKNIKKAVKSAIKRYQPDIIGLSAMTFQYLTAVKLAKYIKSLYPDLPIAIGGYHSTIMYKEIAGDYPELFDFIFRGEADLAFNELLDELESKNDFKKIKGLSYKKGKRFVHNAPRPIEDLADIELPDRDSRIWEGYHGFGIKLDTIETSRGCLNNCKFCSIRNMYGQSRREYSINRVIEDIRNAKELGFRSLFFVDDNITGDVRAIKRFNKLLDAIIDNGLNDIEYITQASSLGMGHDKGIVKKMRKAGFGIVFLGMENMSKKNLKFLRKGNIVNYSRKALDYLIKNDISVIGGIVIGSEMDDEEDIKLNYEQLKEQSVDLKLDQVLTPYPGTEIRDGLVNKGLVTNVDDWRFYNGYFANVETKKLSTDDLNFYKWKYSRDFNKWRLKNFYKLNLFKNHKLFFLKTLFLRILEEIKRFPSSIGKTDYEKFRIDFEDKLNLNKDLI